MVSNGLPSRMRVPHSLKSSNGFAAIAASPIRSTCSSADGLVGATRHIRVHLERRALVHDREVLRGRGGVDALRPRLGELGVGLLRKLRDPPLELLDAPRDPPAPELDPGRGRSELGVGRRLDSVERLEHRLADRLAELVAALEAVLAPCAVAEPVVPRRDVAGAALEEARRATGAGTRASTKRSGPGKSGFQSRLSPPISVG